MNDNIKKRLKWIKLYEAMDDAGLVCRRCSISIRLCGNGGDIIKKGEAGLCNQSRRPQRSPNRKVFESEMIRWSKPVIENWCNWIAR